MIAIYWDNEQKCRKTTKRISYFIALNQGVFIAIFFFSIFCLLTEEFDIFAIALPIKFAVPFEITTIPRWYALWLIEFNIGLAYGFSVVSGTSYFVCCCFYIGAICDHYKLIIQSRIKYIGSPSSEKNNAKKLQEKIKKLLSQAIDIHVNGFE